MSRLSIAVLVLLAGCGSYDPPVTGDRDNSKFQADLIRCRKQASTAASRKANATPQSLAASFFDSGDQERKDVKTCMQGRGYALRTQANR